MNDTTAIITKKLTGFALLSAEERKALGRRGGKAAQDAGKGKRFTSETAKEANRIRVERQTTAN